MDQPQEIEPQPLQEEQPAVLPPTARIACREPMSGEKPHRTPKSVPLKRSGYIVILAISYALVSILAWVVICYLSFKPIGGQCYGAFVENGRRFGGSLNWASYQNSENWYNAARVLSSIVATLTIPIASAVCARAAVAFHQSRRLTLRQTMVLADKGWSQPEVLTKFVFSTSSGRKRISSSFLIIAVVLTLLGTVVGPLQQIFLSTGTVKTPTLANPQPLTIADFYDRFTYSNRTSYDSGITAALLRGRLAVTENSDPQIQLWSLDLNCNYTDLAALELCNIPGGQFSLQNISALNEPFFSQLPSGFNTGVWRQFAPRINSTATRENLSAEDFPVNCDQIPNAFYVKYTNTSTVHGTYSVEACMPGDMTITPWKNTRARQDFSELLYLAIHYSTENATYNPSFALNFQTVSSYTRVTVNTTAGFFQLPNSLNGDAVGPLIEQDPFQSPELCGRDCINQVGSSQPSLEDPPDPGAAPPAVVSNGTAWNATINLIQNTNKGPLLETVIALFGLDSFIDTHTRALQTNGFGMDNATAKVFSDYNQCNGIMPFVALLHDGTLSFSTNPFDKCLFLQSGDPVTNTYEQILVYLASFTDAGLESFQESFVHGSAHERIQNAFTAAAFLANEVQTLIQLWPSLSVFQDSGADLQVPVISLAGLIVVSSVLVLFLVLLLALAIYGWWQPTWTDTLDSFAMLRIGAAIGHPLRPPMEAEAELDGNIHDDTQPLLFPEESTFKFAVLDETSGWVGDTACGNAELGRLTLGAGTPLTVKSSRKKYLCN